MSKDNSFFKTFLSPRQLKRKTGAGFTAIEILVVIAILGVMATIGQMSYYIWLKKVQVNTAVEQIRSSLIRAQQQAVAAENGQAWGVHLEADRYVIFPTTIYDPANTENRVKILSGVSILQPDTSLSDGNAGFSPNVVFEKFTGRTINTGTIIVAVTADQTVTRDLIISFFGAIE